MAVTGSRINDHLESAVPSQHFLEGARSICMKELTRLFVLRKCWITWLLLGFSRAACQTVLDSMSINGLEREHTSIEKKFHFLHSWVSESIMPSHGVITVMSSKCGFIHALRVFRSVNVESVHMAILWGDATVCPSKVMSALLEEKEMEKPWLHIAETETKELSHLGTKRAL